MADVTVSSFMNGRYLSHRTSTDIALACSAMSGMDNSFPGLPLKYRGRDGPSTRQHVSALQPAARLPADDTGQRRSAVHSLSPPGPRASKIL
jgi:hypothetical protein